MDNAAELEDDLFGDDDEEEPAERVRELSDRELDSGDDEERQVKSAVLNDLERLRRAEGGHVVVRENDVPSFGRQCGAQGFGRFHPLKRRLITTLLERADQYPGIKLRVFNDQHPERYFLLSRAHKRLWST